MDSFVIHQYVNKWTGILKSSRYFQSFQQHIVEIGKDNSLMLRNAH